MTNLFDPDALEHLVSSVMILRQRGVELERASARELGRVHPSWRESAANLLHYLALRQEDLRPLQRELHMRGLSSLGRLEAYTQASLDAVLLVLHRLLGRTYVPDPPAPIDFHGGRALLAAHTDALLGPAPAARGVRIMVTVPEDANEAHLEALLRGGMNVMRINCAHGSPADWRSVIDRLRRIEQALGLRCRVLCDLEGPKLRTAKVIAADGNSGALTLERGSHVLLLASDEPCPAVDGTGFFGQEATPVRVGCQLPECLARVSIGDRVFFDDGKLGGIVRDRVRQGLRIEVTRSRDHRARLKGEKSINFPDSPLDIPALTSHDLRALDAIADVADAIGLSFVHEPEDVAALRRELDLRGAAGRGVVLKIETQRAFAAIAPLLLVGMESDAPLGVMVARGDMGVELGFDRMAEAQEELLWIAEAAHVPVVWATQVLESLTKGSIPTRGEVTDAAMAGRAECVMLNKGEYILDSLAFLSDVLERMQEHQMKKQTLLRELSISHWPRARMKADRETHGEKVT